MAKTYGSPKFSSPSKPKEFNKTSKLILSGDQVAAAEAEIIELVKSFVVGAEKNFSFKTNECK